MEKVKRIGEIITEERKKKSISIYRLAKLCKSVDGREMSNSTLTGIENGHSQNPNFDTVVTIARALDVPVSTFFIERRLTDGKT